MNKITSLFSIKYPIIQAGMVWCSGWELASAVSNAGGLGLIGAGSMTPEILKIHIEKVKNATSKPFGVNVPLLYSRIEDTIKLLVEEQIKIVFTSAGNPATWTKFLKDHGITVVHVVSNIKFAKKAEEAGVDAIVAEGVEAGGHNGREESTTLTLIPLIRKATTLPLIAAGGIATGRSMLAAMVLGADGVQIGTRFVASTECSAHDLFKSEVLKLTDGGTRLSLKKLNPVRLIRNEFCNQIEEAEMRCSSKEEIIELLGKGRSKRGMFEGNITEGELEIGQCAALIDSIKPAKEIVDEIITEFNSATTEYSKINFI